MAWVRIKSMVLPARKFSPSPSAASKGTVLSCSSGSKRTTVSSRWRSPCWIYWPMECRSAVNSTLAGNRPLFSLPSDSPYSCFHHSAMNRKLGS